VRIICDADYHCHLQLLRDLNDEKARADEITAKYNHLLAVVTNQEKLISDAESRIAKYVSSNFVLIRGHAFASPHFEIIFQISRHSAPRQRNARASPPRG
jgi:hypothetical protein